MILGIFHKGSGLGNQLHRYVGARVMALDTKSKFGMVAPELFKGESFMDLDMGYEDTEYHIEEPSGKVIPHTHEVVVDGEFQNQDYFIHRLDQVREWLKVEPLDMPDDICVINFRGGEYVGVKDLFLPQEYWDKAIKIMRDRYPNIRFEVHTDDEVTASKFFPEFPCTHDVELNWRSIRYAKHLIVANSSFAILPAFLGDAEEIIAPFAWANHNKGDSWRLGQNYYKRFTYLDNKGEVQSHDSCISLLGKV